MPISVVFYKDCDILLKASVIRFFQEIQSLILPRNLFCVFIKKLAFLAAILFHCFYFIFRLCFFFPFHCPFIWTFIYFSLILALMRLIDRKYSWRRLNEREKFNLEDRKVSFKLVTPSKYPSFPNWSCEFHYSYLS